MLGVVMVYLGLIGAFVGGVSILQPLLFLAIRARRRGALPRARFELATLRLTAVKF
jgi:hypothetical protein